MKSVRKISRTHELEEADGTWAVSYGDMITLLLTFFILFFSTEKAANQKKEEPKAKESPKEEAKKPDEKLIKIAALFDRLEGRLGVRRPAGGVPPRAAASTVPAAPLPAPVARTRGPSVADYVSAKVPQGWTVRIYRFREQIIVDFPGVSFFDFGRTELTSPGTRALAGFASAYADLQKDSRVGIRAYTDDRPVIPGSRVPYRDNWELSALRSVSAMRELVRLGVPIHKLRLGGYGELKATSRDLAAARVEGGESPGAPLDRKVVLTIEADLEDSEVHAQ